MNEERDERIERLLRQGVSKAEIARRLGITWHTVNRVGARVGFPAQPRAGARSYDWPRVQAHYDVPHSAAETKREFGIADSSWRAAIGRGDIVARDRRTQLPPGKRRREVEALLNEGLGITVIAERLGISKPTVCYHARNLGVPARSEFARRFDWEEIARVYDSGVSARECRRRFGCSRESWAQAIRRGDIVPRDRLIPLEELLVKGREGTSRGHLKARLVAAGLKEEKCETCGIESWRGQPMSMQLHHENGDGTDNRLENLSFLCPNCHSQTDTYGGRNSHRRPERHLRLVEDPPEPEADDVRDEADEDQGTG